MLNIVNQALLNRAVNVSSPVVANSTVTFTNLVVSEISTFNPNSTNNRVVVLLSTSKDPKNGVNFSLTGNNGIYTRNREKLLLDDNSTDGIVFFEGGSAQDCVNAWVAKFGDFLQFDKVKVTFGDSVHFRDDNGAMLKTILRVKSIKRG